MYAAESLPPFGFLPFTVFQYLAQLQNSKMEAGHLAGGPASQALKAAQGGCEDGAAASNSGAEEGEPFAVVEVAGGGEGGKAAGKGVGYSSAAAAASLPATVDLQPSKRRGKKTLGQKMGKAAGKCYS
jgi:hypothetical protein